MNFLCPKTEWSGVLFFKAEGSILDPQNLKLHCAHLIPMDIGAHTYTEFEYDAGFTNYVVQHDLDADGWRQSKIHSHCDFGVFHSGTDNSDIVENATHYPYYLSVIVNNNMDWDCKIGVLGKVTIEKSTSATSSTTKTIVSSRDDNSELVTKEPIVATEETEPNITTEEKEVVFFYDGQIFCEEEVKPSEAFMARAEASKTLRRPVTPSYQSFGNSYQNNQGKGSPTANTNPGTSSTVVGNNNTTFHIIPAHVAAEIIAKAVKIPQQSLSEMLKYLCDNDKNSLKTLEAIEKEFDERYLSKTNLSFEYYEYVGAFRDRLKSLSYHGKKVDEYVDYFNQVYIANKPAAFSVDDYDEEEVSKMFSLYEVDNFKELTEYLNGLTTLQLQADYKDKLISYNKSFSKSEINKLFWQKYYGKVTNTGNYAWIVNWLRPTSNEVLNEMNDLEEDEILNRYMY